MNQRVLFVSAVIASTIVLTALVIRFQKADVSKDDKEE